MYRYAFLLCGCFNLIIIMLIASVQGQCNESNLTMRIQECDNMLHLTNFNSGTRITNTMDSKVEADMKNICRYKHKLELCYQLLMLDCPIHEDEIDNRLEYVHDNFNYLCNERIQTYRNVLPCLKYLDIIDVMKTCEQISTRHLHECSKIDKQTTCVSNWAFQSCGSNAGDFMKVLLQTKLALLLPPGKCKFTSKGGESKCSLSNVETKSNICASIIGFSNKDLKQLLVNPLPKLNEKKLDRICKNLQQFQRCFQGINEQCENTNKLMLYKHSYYKNLLNYLCKQDPNVVLIHNYCLTQIPFPYYQKDCFLKGGRKILNSTTSMQACHSLDDAIHCSLELTRKVCSLKDYQFMRSVYEDGVKSTFFQSSCSDMSETTPNSVVTTEKSMKLSNTFSIVVASAAVGCFLVFIGIVSIFVAIHAKKKKGMQESVNNRSLGNTITRPSFIIQPHLPPYDRYENSSAPPAYDEVMAEDYRASNRY